MNIDQLEKILKLCKEIEEILKEDPSGAFFISNKLNALVTIVRNELKEKVWRKYKAERLNKILTHKT